MARSRKTTTQTPDQTVEQNLEPIQYQVTRAFRISSATTLQPGDRITPSDNWPHRRAKQFVDQGFLIPVPANAIRPDTHTEDSDEEAADSDRSV